MKSPIHVPDQVLRKLVSNSNPLSDQNDVETHISECELCQTRLLAVAADPEWRKTAVANLSENKGSISQSSSISNLSSENICRGDEYDLSTVDALLAEVLSPPTHPEMLGRLGRYEVECVIGCGGMGVVLRAYDRELQRPVAIKLILPRLSKNGTAKQRFAREARAAAAVLHPNVIGIHGIDETNGVPWFVMPLVAGPSLKELVDDKGPLPEREIVQIVMQVASGLAAAHSQGLVHRDIKPENILIDNQINRVIITDFGLARRQSEEPMTQTGIVAGTINYMSPEQASGQPIDGRSDLFSLGSLLFYLAAGVLPFQSDAPMGVLNKISNEPHTDVRTFNPDVSATLVGLIDRLLAKKPEHRFQTASELEMILTQYVTHLNQPATFPLPEFNSVPRDNFGMRSRRTWATALGAVIVAPIACWLGYLSLFGYPRPMSTEEMWQTIQNEHELSDPRSFLEESRKLRDELVYLEQRLPSHRAFEDEKMASELDSIDRQMNWINKQLELK